MNACVHIIGGCWKRSPLPVPALQDVRPTPARVRETVFNWLGQQLHGRACLDLFAGSGALGFEAASRGAARVVLVEQHPHLVRQLRQNQKKLTARVIEIISADAVRFLSIGASERFDVIFVDPPFRSDLIQRVVPLCHTRMRANGVVYVESSKPLDPRALYMAAHWRIVRQARAGAVHYALLQQKNSEYF